MYISFAAICYQFFVAFTWNYMKFDPRAFTRIHFSCWNENRLLLLKDINRRYRTRSLLNVNSSTIEPFFSFNILHYSIYCRRSWAFRNVVRAYKRLFSNTLNAFPEIPWLCNLGCIEEEIESFFPSASSRNKVVKARECLDGGTRKCRIGRYWICLRNCE